MFARAPIRQRNSISQQSLTRFSCVAQPPRNASEERNNSGFKSILKKDREIKPTSLPFANLIDHAQRVASIVDEQLIDECLIVEDTARPGSNCQRNLSIRQYLSECAQCGDSHHCITDPICAANDNFLYSVSVHARQINLRIPSSIVVVGCQRRSFLMCDKSET